MGAERLLGKGDMLYLKPGNSKFERIQGAFLDDSEVVSMVDAIKVSGTSHYNQDAIKWIEEEYERQNASSSGGLLEEGPMKMIQNGTKQLMLV